MFFIGLATLVGVGMARPTWRAGDMRQMEHDMDRARRLIAQHRVDLGELVPLAERLAQQATRHTEQAGEIEYLVGNLYVRIAERDPATPVIDAWGKARLHLEEAHTLGVSENDFVRLTYQLAKAWFYTGGDIQEVIDALTHSIESGSDRPAEGYALLAQAYLRLPNRDVEGALNANEKELSVPYVGEDLLAPARLLRGELLFELKRPEEARKVLANIGIQAPPQILARARYLRALNMQEEERWLEAENLWKESLEDKAVPATDPARTLYNLGLCHRNLGESSEATRVWTECAQRGDADQAGPAALVQLAELQVADGDSTRVADTLTQAVRDFKNASEWHNTLIDIHRLSDAFENGCKLLRKEGRFEQSVRLATLYERFAGDAKAEVQLGTAASEWGQSLLAGQAEEARGKFRAAGEAFEKSAGLSADPDDRAERLWSAAESFALAAEAKPTIAAVEALFDLSKRESVSLDPQRKGKALFLRAEAHRALGEDTLAQHFYGECINFRTPYAYRARGRLATAALEQKKVDEARSMLEQNLNLLHLDEAPDSEALKSTLYTLARLLFASGEFSAAVTHFKEALEKFGDQPEALRARFELAESYAALAAEQVKAVTGGTRLSEAAQKNHEREYSRCFTEAARNYQQVADELTKLAATRTLSPEEEGMAWLAQILRAFFRHSDGKYGEALKLYQELADRYKGKAQELYALRGVVGCYWSRNEPGDTIKAAQTVELIRGLTAKFSDADLKIAPDLWTRKQWDDWIQKTSRTPEKKQ
jgi:tetratricopeptide (TPR) repeat protein